MLNREYEALCDASDAGEDTLIDPYGSEDPAEFFAVATEVFIELPQALQAQHRELYASLAALYALDPARWPPPRCGDDGHHGLDPACHRAVAEAAGDRGFRGIGGRGQSRRIARLDFIRRTGVPRNRPPRRRAPSRRDSPR